jgi:hypothetical protein
VSSSAPAPKSRIAQNKPPGSTAYQLQAQIARCRECAAQRRAPSLPPPNIQDKERLTCRRRNMQSIYLSITCQMQLPAEIVILCRYVLIRIINIFSITNCINFSMPLFLFKNADEIIGAPVLFLVVGISKTRGKPSL